MFLALLSSVCFHLTLPVSMYVSVSSPHAANRNLGIKAAGELFILRDICVWGHSFPLPRSVLMDVLIDCFYFHIFRKKYKRQIFTENKNGYIFFPSSLE